MAACSILGGRERASTPHLYRQEWARLARRAWAVCRLLVSIHPNKTGLADNCQASSMDGFHVTGWAGNTAAWGDRGSGNSAAAWGDQGSGNSAAAWGDRGSGNTVVGKACVSDEVHGIWRKPLPSPRLLRGTLRPPKTHAPPGSAHRRSEGTLGAFSSMSSNVGSGTFPKIERSIARAEVMIN